MWLLEASWPLPRCAAGLLTPGLRRGRVLDSPGKAVRKRQRELRAPLSAFLEGQGPAGLTQPPFPPQAALPPWCLLPSRAWGLHRSPQGPIPLPLSQAERQVLPSRHTTALWPGPECLRQAGSMACVLSRARTIWVVKAKTMDLPYYGASHAVTCCSVPTAQAGRQKAAPRLDWGGVFGPGTLPIGAVGCGSE